MIKEYFADLENYDGQKAYFGSERYTILDIDSEKYAFPSDFDLIKAVSEAKGEEKIRLGERYPIFQILKENFGICEARAIKVNFKRDSLLRRVAEQI